MRRALAAATAAVLAAGLLLAGSAVPAAASGPGSGTVVARVNAARAAAGLPAYRSRSDLAGVALRWAGELARSGVLRHNPGLAGQVSGWRYVGENVGYGPDVSSVQSAFMGSPGHRSNILDGDFTEIGVGVVDAGDRVWVVQVFRAPRSSSVATSRASSRPGARTSATSARARPVSANATASSQPATGDPAERRGAARPRPATPEVALAARRAALLAAARRGARPADPLTSALTFAAAMRIVAGS